LVEVGVDVGDLVVEVLPAASEAAQRQPSRLEWAARRVPVEAGGAGDDVDDGLSGEALSELGGGGVQHGVDRDGEQGPKEGRDSIERSVGVVDVELDGVGGGRGLHQ